MTNSETGPAECASSAWMRLPSGRRLDLMNPAPEAWTDEDLAVRLGRTFRWGGESRWPVPLSVAQHSLTVLALAEADHQVRTGAPLPSAAALHELLHDAEEAFLGFDCIRPLKRALGEPFRRVEHGLVEAIARRYDFASPSGAALEAHRRADRVSAASEAFHVVGWAVDEIRHVLGIEEGVLERDPLVQAGVVDRWKPWEPWPADVSAERFLVQLRLLLEQRRAEEDESR